MADELDARLPRVVGCPGAVEILDALVPGARSRIELQVIVHLSRRRIGVVLRSLAAEGLLHRCDDPGSWDLRPARETRYALTAQGRSTVAELSDVDVWVAIYENYLYRL